jgi:hypothetical protein
MRLPDPKRRFVELRECQSKQQQNQRNDNLRVLLIEVVFPLPELDFHRRGNSPLLFRRAVGSYRGHI